MANMKRLVTGAVMAAAALCGAYAFTPAPVARAVPEPALVPPAGTYELAFKQFAPERLEITENGKTVTYWYLRYTVTNNTKSDVIFTPEFELVTDSGQAIKAYKGVDREIFNKIKKLHNAPLMENPFEILGKLLPGVDNARDGVAIFTGVNTEARVFRFYVQGLSNEVKHVKVGASDATLVKTLELEYKLPGLQIGVAPVPEFKGRKWILK